MRLAPTIQHANLPGMAATTDDAAAEPAGDDRQDIMAWSRTRDEAAFARIVQRHIRMIRAVCERRLGHGMDADEAAQAVFVVLARRADGIRDPDRLGPWLYGTALRVCQASQRSMRRRAQHEREAATVLAEQRSRDGGNGTDWSRIRPHLDEAIASLSTQQRDAVTCRLLQGLSYTESAQRLGISEDAVRKRVEYGVGKLRSWFHRRGLGVTAAALAAGLASELRAAEPPLIEACISGALQRHQPPTAVMALADAAGQAPRRAWQALAAAILCMAMAGWAAWPRPDPPAARPVTVDPAPAKPWLHADLEREAIAFAGPDGTDPIGLFRHLGGRPASLHPDLRIDLEPGRDGPRAAIRLRGLAALSPLPMLALLAGSDRLVLIDADALRPIDRRHAPSAMTGELLRLSIGCDPQRLAPLPQMLAELLPLSLAPNSASLHDLPQALARMRQDPALAPTADFWELSGLVLDLRGRKAAAAILRDHLSGDATILATAAPGGYAACSFVLGLRTPLDEAGLRAAMPAFIPLPETWTGQDGAKAWRIDLLGRRWALAMTRERLVLSELEDPAPLLTGSAEADAGHPGAAMAWNVDLQALARLDAADDGWRGLLSAWWPRLPAMLDDLRRGAGTDLPTWLGVDGSHQPRQHLAALPWSGWWIATGDGISAGETGPPILSTLLAATVATIAGGDPGATRAAAAERRETALACIRYQRPLRALGQAHDLVGSGAQVPANLLADLAPLLHGREQGTPGLRALLAQGAVPERNAPRVQLAYAAVVPASGNQPVLFTCSGPLVWHARIDSDWSIAVVDADASDGFLPVSKGPSWSAEMVVRKIGLIRTRDLARLP